MMAGTIDESVFRELQATAGEDFVAELVTTFLEEAPEMLSALREAVAAADAERFRRTAHSLKSNCNTFGALGLGTMARTLELGGLHADPAQDAAALDALDAAYATAATALREMSHG
jgi:HPt (histidine-containing phosphotransfer) domain-containing protein